MKWSLSLRGVANLGQGVCLSIPPISSLKLGKQDGSNRGNISAGCDEHSGVLVEKIALEVTYDKYLDNIIQKLDSFTGDSVTACGVLMQSCTTGCWDDIDVFFLKAMKAHI